MSATDSILSGQVSHANGNADAVAEISSDVKQNQPTDEQASLGGERNNLTRILGAITVAALFATGLMTFLILFGLTPLEPNRFVVRSALAVNTLLALILIVLVGIEVSQLLKSRRKGRAAARLHIRIVGLFALVAAIPAILVAIIASVTLDLGLDRWFELRTKSIIEGSVSIAEAYIDESTRVHINATVSMANELDRARRLYSLDRQGFQELLNGQTRGRGMLAAYVLGEDGSKNASSVTDEKADVPEVPQESFEAAKNGDVIFIPRGATKLVGAVIKLRAIPNAFLYTIRPLRDDVLNSLQQMQANTNEYSELEQSRLPVQLTFAVLYLGVALMVLLAAIWMGISVADRFVRPIRRLINAADEISTGNLDVYVDTKHTEGDFKNLGDTFNEMTSELKSQRTQLLQANDDINKRARFTEAVLSGVTAAVLSIDSSGRIKIANPTSNSILGPGIKQGAFLADQYPILAEMLQDAKMSAKRDYRETTTLMIDGQSRTLSVQITHVEDSLEDEGHVITIDDVTDLVAAQRNTAWSDVARRIAHEIKNPLTPIQLSAERIRKRYSKFITEDKEVFDQCTDTIIRQVGDIGRMVDEFSSFARMPKPEMRLADLGRTIQEAVFTQKVANPDISFDIQLGDDKLTAELDERLMSQAFINLVKNAVEAIEAVPQADLDEKGGVILINAKVLDGTICINIIDNGKGLPIENRHQLLEPYMTTRLKGTGLGLAIVRKILEDHAATIELLDAPAVAAGGRGAMIRIKIPVASKTDDANGRLADHEQPAKQKTVRTQEATS